jgi:hypothetical protein
VRKEHEETTFVAFGDVPPTRSLPVSKMDSPNSARYPSRMTGETSRQHPLTGGLPMGGTHCSLIGATQ